MTVFTLDKKLSIEPEYGMVLKDSVLKNKPDVIVEIGTGQGYSTAWLLEGVNENKKGEIFTYDSVDRSPYAWDAEGIPDGRVHVSVGDEFGEKLDLPKRIDFVFHDAGHWIEHVQHDLEIVMPLMNTGSKGIIFIHDIVYSNDMGEKIKKWFENKKGWTYRELRDGCGMGIAEKI